MTATRINTVVVGGGQAGLAMSEHLGTLGVEHVILERSRIAESWRTARWDSLVANGPAWHDRFPTLEFEDVDPDGFATRDDVVRYFETHAQQIAAPIRCGVAVTGVRPDPETAGYVLDTSAGELRADNVVAATGPFQRPLIPPVVPDDAGFTQLHSSAYRNPAELPEGAVLVVGAGSSGTQIADELRRAGRRVFLSVGPHDRPPRRYRGKDFVWWLGKLGKWEMKVADPATAHVTIAVSGADGGRTIDFRDFADAGVTLLGMTRGFENGVLHVALDLADNLLAGDDKYLALLREADAFVAANGLDLPEEPDAHVIGPLPACATEPHLEVDLHAAGVTSIVWSTGYALDFDWLDVDVFDAEGRPRHDRGVGAQPGIYFIGLPWLSMRGSSFIWGVWVDAKHVAGHIAARAAPGPGR